ncbi:Protein of uncharacterised function (DUF1446) [Mycobacteroides abscessus subsp. abscessus]|nr:Protein of uncharacterised function (DUF1446) [Mycobacteroides abscessus subsp. abscessus]
MAGAVAAGHIIECGTQATGGNYAFFTEIADLAHAGFPLAEVYEDGSSVITKHTGTGGAVSVGTVTAQLLYEITGGRYANPDVTTRIDSIELSQEGPDRVRVSGVTGEAPPPDLKVSLNALGGFRNQMTFVLTGLNIDAKADLTRRQLEAALTSPPEDIQWTLGRTDHPNADTEQAASALLHVMVRDSDPNKVGRQFSNAAAGARSGDKGGSANVGVWVRTDEEYRWLAHALTVDALRELLPETEHLEVARYLLPKLRAVNFVIQDILGKGVAYQARFDPQAKGIGEWLRSREIDIPESLLEGK